MHNNKLTSLSGGGALSDLSLLVILDIHGNEFTHLPSDIMCLASLKVYIISIFNYWNMSYELNLFEIQKKKKLFFNHIIYFRNFIYKTTIYENCQMK